MFEKLRKLLFSPDPKRNTRFEVTLHIEGQGADGKFLATTDDEYVIGVEPAGSILFEQHTLKVRSPILNQQADLVFKSRDGFIKDGVFTIRVDKCGGNADDRTEAEVRVSSIALATAPATTTVETTTAAALPEIGLSAASPGAAALPTIGLTTTPTAAAAPTSPVTAAATPPVPPTRPVTTPPPIVPTIKRKSRFGRWMMSAVLLTIFGGTVAFLLTRDYEKKPVAVAMQSKPQNITPAVPLDPADTTSVEPSVTDEDTTTQPAPAPAPAPTPALTPDPAVVAPTPAVAPQPTAIDPIPNPTTQPPAKYVRIHY